MGQSNQLKDLHRQLKKQGFEMHRVTNGHYKVIAPDGRKCQIAATPRYPRAVLNIITRLKRIGFVQDA